MYVCMYVYIYIYPPTDGERLKGIFTTTARILFYNSWKRNCGTLQMHCSEFYQWQIHFNSTHMVVYTTPTHTLVPEPQNFLNIRKLWVVRHQWMDKEKERADISILESERVYMSIYIVRERDSETHTHTHTHTHTQMKCEGARAACHAPRMCVCMYSPDACKCVTYRRAWRRWNSRSGSLRVTCKRTRASSGLHALLVQQYLLSLLVQ
jgi:hypothetical protein